MMQTTEQQPVFPDDVNYSFEISTVELFTLTRDLATEPIRRPTYQIVWVTKGSGYFSIDLKKYRIKDNAIYTIPPGLFHQIMPGGRISGYVLTFNIDFLYLAIGGSGRILFEEISSDLNRVNMYFPKIGDRELQNVVTDISREFNAHLTLRLEILSGLFKMFLLYMHRNSTTILQQGVSRRSMRLFNSFYAKLDNHFRARKQVTDYANELFVSPGYLTDVVKKVTGHSASYHIRQRTVQEAKRMLMYNDVNMKMVAYTLGFEDLSHFSKYFKNATGMRFTEFKKKTFIRQSN
jgi:AraC family transcriptional activator of pobA